MKFKGILPQRKAWVKLFVAAIAGYMIVLEFMRGEYIYIPVAILVILACFLKKEQVITEKGVDITLGLFSMDLHSLWTWDEITSLHTDYTKAKPKVMLHIGKDIVTRSFVMEIADCKAVLAMAAQINPKIYIEDLSEDEQEEREREIYRRQQQRKAQAAAQKAAKRKKK